jgi:hypothetical protein
VEWIRFEVRVTMSVLIYPCLVTGRWSSLVTPVSSTNKTDLYDIIEILLKVALSTITLTHIYVVFFMRIIDMSMCKSGQIKINIKWHKQWQNGQFYLKNINVSWSTGVGVDHKGGHVLNFSKAEFLARKQIKYFVQYALKTKYLIFSLFDSYENLHSPYYSVHS